MSTPSFKAIHGLAGSLVCTLVLLGCPGSEDGTTQGGDGSAVGVDANRPARLATPEQEASSPATRALDDELSRLDPVADGFESELVSSKGEETLKVMTKHLGESVDTAALQALVAADFVGSQLRPVAMNVVFEGQGLEVLAGGNEPAVHLGVAGLVSAVEHLGRPFEGGQVEVKFKMVGVELLANGEVETDIIYLGMGAGEHGPVQQNANWVARWSVAEGFDKPLLLALEASDYSESRAAAPLYADVTESVFGDSRAVARVRRGIDSWWGRIDTGLGYSFYGDYALVLGDVDNDGLDDLYFCQPGGIPNQLLKHNADGTLTDISQSSSTDLLNDTPTALFVDLDNDGNQDLVVANLLYLAVMRGDGTGGFSLASEVQVDNAVSISAADYDSDGALDLYVARYSSSRSTPSGAAVYDSNEGRPNVLLRNEGGLRFRDVTLESGANDNNSKFSFASVWEDYDNDGDQDLYVANDFGRNNLYRNDGGRLTDVASQVGAEDSAAGMGATWADYDQDGLMDLYVSNMFSSAGGRIIDQPKISTLAGGEDALDPLRRFAKGNTLLRNQGDGTFDDVSAEAGVMMGRWSWGGEFVDCNNDGLQDLMVPNGFITNDDSKDL